MRTLVKRGLVLASFAVLAACGGEPAKDPSSANTPEPTPPVASPMPESRPATADAKPADTSSAPGGAGDTASTPATPPKTLSDAEIVAVASAANNGEIEMAELAKKQGTSKDVKDFAAMMITQHRDAEAKGKTITTKAKITPAENDDSTKLKSDVSSAITSMKTQKGKDFDKAYIEANVKAHRQVLDALDNKMIPNAQNSELKTHLGDVRKHVASHLAKAEEIQQKLDAPSSAGGQATGTGPKTDTKPNAAPTPKK